MALCAADKALLAAYVRIGIGRPADLARAYKAGGGPPSINGPRTIEALTKLLNSADIEVAAYVATARARSDESLVKGVEKTEQAAWELQAALTEQIKASVEAKTKRLRDPDTKPSDIAKLGREAREDVKTLGNRGKLPDMAALFSAQRQLTDAQKELAALEAEDARKKGASPDAFVAVMEKTSGQA